MDFEKPALAVALKKLTRHLQETHELNEIEELARLKKKLSFWKLKNRQCFHESKILEEKHSNAAARNRQTLADLVALRNQLLKYAPASSAGETPEAQSALAETHKGGAKAKALFKPKSILLKGSSMAEKPSKKYLVAGLEKKVSFASDFDLGQREAPGKRKLAKMTSCFEESQRPAPAEEAQSKAETGSIRELEPESQDSREGLFRTEFSQKHEQLKNSYRFVENEKYESTSENLSDLGRSCPPQGHSGKAQLFQQLRENVLFGHAEPSAAEK